MLKMAYNQITDANFRRIYKITFYSEFVCSSNFIPFTTLAPRRAGRIIYVS